MNDPFVLHHQATGQLLIYVTYKYMGKDVSVLSMLHCQKKNHVSFVSYALWLWRLSWHLPSIHPSIHPRNCPAYNTSIGFSRGRALDECQKGAFVSCSRRGGTKGGCVSLSWCAYQPTDSIISIRRWQRSKTASLILPSHGINAE